MRHFLILILGAVLTACADPVAPPVPAAVEIAQAPPAIVLPGAVIDTISVRVLTAHGEGVSGWRVTWSGEGTVEPLDSVTDEVGLARARWTLPRYDLVSPQFHMPGPSGRYTAHAEAIGLGGPRFTVEARAFRVDRVDAAFNYACGIRSDGLWCWGRYPEAVGLARAPVPERVSLPAGVVPSAVRVTESVACVLDQAGVPWCATVAVPGQFTRVTGAPALHEIDGAANPSSFVVEGGYFCGRARESGLPWCWRYDAAGTPHGETIGDMPMISLVAGSLFGCGVDAQHVAWCWGRNDHGQVGDGTTIDRPLPVPVGGDLRFERLTANNLGACGSTLEHRAYCWGWTYFPETHTPRLVTSSAIVGPDITLGGTGELHAIVAGDLRTWFNGENLPIFVNIDRVDVAEVSGDGQSCIRARDGQVFCSWILLSGGGDTSIFTADVVPVPDPASVTP